MDERIKGWTAPDRDERDTGVRGALGGSRLFEQPQYAGEVERFRAFLVAPGPVAVEVGFDFGHRLRDHAARWPEERWLGLEVRKARVDALAADAPGNLLAWRADARTVFAALMPAGRLDRVDILFPTPWWDEGKREKRMLLTPAFVADLSRSLRPGGVVHVATDVGPYFEHVEGLFASWRLAKAPPVGEALSRRERVCLRDGLAVHAGTWTPSDD